MAADHLENTANYPVYPDLMPSKDLVEGKYRVTFARSEEQLERVQRLRFNVFNVEMNEGLEESFETGLDQDPFDPVCHHLMVMDTKNDELVGTYRMQTNEMAMDHLGFYSAAEFDFDEMPDPILCNAVEVGRACVAKAHRNRLVLFMLWRGLASYMQATGKRFLFGCCSLTSQDPIEGKQVMEHLRRERQVLSGFFLRTRRDWVCYEEPFPLSEAQASAKVELPRLFRTYLRFGAKVCSEPALDRSFKTIDYLILFDLDALDGPSRAMFFH